MPPGLITLYIHNKAFGQEIKPWLSNALTGFIDQHPFVTYGAAIAYVYALNAMYAFIESRAKKTNSIDAPGFLALFNALEKIVGAKAKRFGQQVKILRTSTEKPLAASVFETITQPEQQMALLAENLHAFLDAIDKTDTSFRVGIVVIEDDKPIDWLYFSPASEPPRTPIADLRSPQSTICTCVRDRQIVIVEDIQREAQRPRSKRRYVAGRDANEEGSQICFPVHHPYTDTIPYVIAVAANKRKYFSGKNKELYVWALKHFAIRLELEHSLLVLRQGAII